MNTEAEARIFLREQRACVQTPTHRSYRTFNFKPPFREGKDPVAPLFALNDETLGSNAKTHYEYNENGQTLIIPLVGCCEVTTENNHGRIDVGQAFFTGSSSFVIKNPYEEELISYLLVGLECHTNDTTINFELDLHKNRLIQLSGEGVPVYLGKFDGRADELVLLKNKRAFVFVVEGVFEVQSRLLHARDALSLTHLTQLEFESLSNEAILLVIG